MKAHLPATISKARRRILAGFVFPAMLKLLVDNQEIKAREGTTLLQACLENEIYIPNLCYIDGMNPPPASCRLCFVDIEGEEGPVTSCTIQVREGMVVRTNTHAVRKLQRTAFRLLLSVHDTDCRKCPANKKCQLQRIARFLKVGLRPKNLDRLLKKEENDETHPFLKYYPNRCVLCGKCVHICQMRHGKPFLTFAKRGFDTIISFYGEKDASELPCREGPACVEICPVGAIILKT
jgi:bidirectional [NiFe] hydrogenase diaphorase subunit